MCLIGEGGGGGGGEGGKALDFSPKGKAGLIILFCSGSFYIQISFSMVLFKLKKKTMGIAFHKIASTELK